MVLALVLAAAASAAPVLPSFESALQSLRSSVGAARAAQLEVKNAALAQRIDRASWDAADREREAAALRQELDRLKWDLQRGTDPGLREAVQRLGRRLDDHARQLDWDLSRLRAVRQAVATKDPALLPSAQRLESQVRRLTDTSRWLENEARWIGSDLRRAGYSFEAMDYERALRDIEDRVRGTDGETRAILAKLR